MAQSPSEDAPGRSVSPDEIEYRATNKIPQDAVLALYRANHWSSARKPEALHRALENSHSLITAWHSGRLVGLANAISDGYLVVYYAHTVVLPAYQRQGIGRQLMQRIMDRYQGFHQQTILADGDAAGFYEKLGFQLAGRTKPLWIFDGAEHS